MKILIDIGHPAHVHLFKNFTWEMQKKGHDILFTCREKEFEIELLSHYGFKFKSFGKKYKSTFGKLWGLIEFDIKEFIEGLKFRPDFFLSHGSIYAAHASFLLNKPHICFEDTFNFEQINLYKPFTDIILTGDYPHPELGVKEVRIKGYHELAYLHPNYFKPDELIFDDLGINNNEKYIIIRFIAWESTHDFGCKGMLLEQRIEIIKELGKFAKVFISSEKILPKELEKYRIKIEPHRMHDFLAFASLFFGEGATMAEESALLGIPTILIYKSILFYPRHLEEKYKLIFNYNLDLLEQARAIDRAIELVTTPNIKDEWKKRSEKMLKEKIDVTAFLVWFVENYPDSFMTMKNNPNYQDKWMGVNIL